MEHLTSSAFEAPGPVDCGADPTSALTTMFVDMVQAGRIAKGQCPALRPVFLKPHGVAHARFEVRDGFDADVPPQIAAGLRVGLFAEPGRAYPAWVRFSSDTQPTGTDYRSTVGIGIKLFDVPGRKLLGNPEARTFDILMQNMDVFFVDTAADMCAFTRAGVVDGNYAPYLEAHPKTADLLAAMAKPVASLLATPYWSGLPFRLGAGFVKYKLEPTLALDAPGEAPRDPAYLAADLQARLQAGEARFRFCVQWRTDERLMPLDAATVAWPEDLSPPIHVADLVLPVQDTAARGQAAYGENLAFNIWRVTGEHAPVGSVAETRRAVYAASADQRRNVNGVPLGEPDVPRPAIAPPRPVDTVVVRAKIHPSIGVARIGDSADGFFIGPEVVDPPPAASPDRYRDETGAIKRQAARFRLYGYNAAGEPVRELDPDGADITWTVHVANRKAQWYRFQYALDMPEAVDAPDNAFPLRNAAVAAAARPGLVVDPGPRSISGRNASGGAEHRFDTGTFRARAAEPVAVALGEIRTDEAGRLVFLGGTGKSASPTHAPVYDPDDPPTFNNADDWYDDTSDGPVTATVSIDGAAIPVDPAWVIVAPPDYAPGVVGWRTMYDLMTDVAVEAGWATMPETPSFSRDILPILARLGGLQWVNQGFAALFGKGCPMDFGDPKLLAKLSHRPARPGGPDPYAEMRRAIFHGFRPARPRVAEPVTWPHLWPWIYGDAFGSFSDKGTGNMLSLSGLQEGLLRRWVEGRFLADWPDARAVVASIDDLPLAERPAMLDKASLHSCLADTFHPGCEMTWPMRHASLYAEPYRIRHRPAGEPEPDYGPHMTPTKVLQVGGPLYAQGPGGLTRWMALPWQGDTAFCRSGYDPEFDPYLPTFWAARVPNQVLTEEDYAKVVDESLPREERLAAFAQRRNWLRAIKDHDTPAVMNLMIARFGQLGIVETRPGVVGDPEIPEHVRVETLPEGELKDAALRATALLRGRPQPASKLERAGWASQEQFEAFRAVRVRHR